MRSSLLVVVLLFALSASLAENVTLQQGVAGFSNTTDYNLSLYLFPAGFSNTTDYNITLLAAPVGFSNASGEAVPPDSPAPSPAPSGGSASPSPPFVFEYPPANQSFFGIFNFQFAREIVLGIELRRNVTPSVTLTEAVFNNYGSVGLDNRTLFRLYDIRVQPGSGSDFVSMALNLSYDQNYVERAAFFEDTLRWYSYDPLAGRWVAEPTVLDMRNNTIYARVNHTSLFGVFGRRNLTTPEEFIKKTGLAFAEKDFQSLMLGAVAIIFIVLIILWRRYSRLHTRRAHSESASS